MKLIVVEIVVGFGLPFAWGVWELVKLRREQRRDAEAAAAATATVNDDAFEDQNASDIGSKAATGASRDP